MNTNFNIEMVTHNLPANKTLFYPCCGNDIVDAIKYFHPIIDTFFFCDINVYSIDRNENVKRINEILPNFDLFKSTEECFWMRNYDLRCRKKIISGRERIVEPLIYKRTRVRKLIQTWRSEKESRDITIISALGDGYEVFSNDELLTQIGIFFYRGDSYGEGGSDVRWLESENEFQRDGYGRHIDTVLQKIADKGLIVTDGSNIGNMYRFLKYSDVNSNKMNEATINNISFKLIGQLVTNHRDTYVWQIEKDNII